MAVLPDYQPNLVPEGRYEFQITDEPEVRKTGNSKWLIFRFLITDPSGGTRKFSNVFFMGDEKYRAVLLVAGGEPDENGIPHLSNMDTSELVGVRFEADIIHEPDKKDPSRIRDNIVNVGVKGKQEADEDVPPPTNNIKEDDPEIPF